MNTIEKEKHVSILDLTCFFVVIYFLWWAMEMIINSVTGNLQGNYLLLGVLLTLSLVSQVGLNIVPGAVLCKLKGLAFRKMLKINPVTAQQFILSLILFLSFNGMALFLDNLIDIIAGRFGSGYEMNDYVFAKDLPTLLVLILAGGLITPLCEELFYRGFLIGINEKRGMRYSIIYSAVCFSIMHTNPYRLLSLFMYSVFMGIIVYYTNSTLPGVIFHVLNNSIYEIGSYITRGDLVTTSLIGAKGSGDNLIKLMIYGVIFVVCLAASYMAIKKLKGIRQVNNSTLIDDSYSGNHEPSQKMKICISMMALAAIFIFKVSLVYP
jgi:membrane protease YdiL (CAAX protease family)